MINRINSHLSSYFSVSKTLVTEKKNGAVESVDLIQKGDSSQLVYTDYTGTSSTVDVTMTDDEVETFKKRIKNSMFFAQAFQLSFKESIHDVDSCLHDDDTSLSDGILALLEEDTDSFKTSVLDQCKLYIDANFVHDKYHGYNIAKKVKYFFSRFCDKGNKGAFKERSLAAFVMSIFIGEYNEAIHEVMYRNWGAKDVQKTGFGSKNKDYNASSATAEEDFTVIDKDGTVFKLEAQTTTWNKEITIKTSKIDHGSKVVIMTKWYDKIKYCVVDTSQLTPSILASHWTFNDNGDNTKKSYTRKMKYSDWTEYTPNSDGVLANLEKASIL